MMKKRADRIVALGKAFILLVTIPCALNFQLRAEDAIPATHVGTWKRVEVIDKRTGNRAKAAARYFMIMRPDGRVQWLGSKGAPDHPPMKLIIRNGSDMYQQTLSGEKAIGKAVVEGNHLTMIFQPVPIIANSGYVRFSNSVDPKDVANIKP